MGKLYVSFPTLVQNTAIYSIKPIFNGILDQSILSRERPIGLSVLSVIDLSVPNLNIELSAYYLSRSDMPMQLPQPVCA